MSEATQAKLLVIACGALAREIIWLQKSSLAENSLWAQMDLQCLDAELHNSPKLITGKVREKIALNRGRYKQIFVAYGDCGSGGDIDRLIVEEGIERLPGAHCYSFFAGQKQFDALAEQEPGTFFLTDFLAEHFERLVIKGLQLDRHPQLRGQFFAHYKRLVYLSQRQEQRLISAAQQAADYLELAFEHHHCGYGDLHTALDAQILKLS